MFGGGGGRVAAEIRLKSQKLGILILHVGLDSAATKSDYMLDLSLSVMTNCI